MPVSNFLARFWRGPRKPPPQKGLTPVETAFLQRIPKAELHVHFEGSLPADILYNLGRKYECPEIRSRDDATRMLRFRTPQEFFERFMFAALLLRQAEDFYQAALLVGQRFRDENIRYAEITIAPHKYVRAGVPYADLMQAMDAGLRQASPETQFRYVIDIVRDLGPEYGMAMLDLIEQHPMEAVVGIGLGGSEAHPPGQSAEVFKRAARAGLRKTAHAGEGMGAPIVWDTIQALGVERIDHGVRAIEEPGLVDYLAVQQIPLNLCISSNVMLGVVKKAEDHPIRRFHDKGIPVNVSTDDPPFFQTTLCRELELLLTHTGFPIREIPKLMLNAIRASFMPDPEKGTWCREFQEESRALAKECGVIG